MINLDSELAEEYLADSAEHLATVETCLLTIEKGAPSVDAEPINRAFRAVHSIKGGAGVFELAKIGELAHRLESALELVRSRKLVPTKERVAVLLRATDRLTQLIQKAGTSNQADIADALTALAGLATDHALSAENRRASPAAETQPNGGRLRILLVEDDFASRLLLQTFLSRYGECHIAVNGREAVDAFRTALEHGERYDLICMDIMMPEMNGREAVRQVRELEETFGILSTSGAKIIMTTAVDEVKEVIRCFKELCDAYLVKPIDLNQLVGHMRSFRLVP
ncbi:MAG: response regulator [Bryobacteraceae bacterium]|jgi:two-component system chemotaxis response regulator CheY